MNSRVILPPVDGARGSSGVWSVTSPAHDGHGGPEDRVEPRSYNQKVVRSSRHLLAWRDERRWNQWQKGGWMVSMSINRLAWLDVLLMTSYVRLSSTWFNFNVIARHKNRATTCSSTKLNCNKVLLRNFKSNVFCQRYLQNTTHIHIGWKYTDELYLYFVKYNDFEGDNK